MIIQDQQQAEYLHDLEAAYTCEGDLLRYFDTREEALEWETQKEPKKM